MKSSAGRSKAGSAGGAAAVPPARRAAAPRAGARSDALAILERADRGEFPASLYLEGPSEALKAELLSALRHAWARSCPEAPLARVLRAAESGVEEILGAYQGGSLFSPRELTVVLDIEDLGRSEKRVAALAAGLAMPAGPSTLVLVESAADAPRKSLEPVRAACGERVVLMPPERRTLLGWGARRLASEGVRADSGVLEAAADACEGDALAFFNELAKLATWAGQGTLSRAEAERLLRPAMSAELPDYLAAVAAGEPRMAAQRLGRMLASGVGEGTVLFALSNLVGGALGGWARFREASDAMRRRRGARELFHALDAVYRAEAAWKGGRADSIAVLEQVTREVCGSS
jgi:DNA polymerase III delta subunit